MLILLVNMKISYRTYKIKIGNILLLIALFFYLYGVGFSFLPLGTNKIIGMFLGLYILIFNLKSFIYFIKKNNALTYFFIMNIFLLIYTVNVTNYLVSNDYSLVYLFVIRVTVLFFPILFIAYLYNKKGIDKFLFDLMIVITIQSLLIYLSFFSLDFKLFVSTILPQTGIMEGTRNFRVSGFTNTASASLSIVQGIGAYIAGYFLVKNKNTYISFVFFIIIILNIGATIFIGRTGLVLFGLTFFTYLLYQTFKGNSNIYYKLVIFISILIFVLTQLYLLIPIEQKELLETRIFPWALELFINMLNSGEATTSSNETLWKMLFLPQNIYTFVFGDGLYNVINGNYMHTDSGYVRMIFAIGLVGTFLLYIPMLYIWKKIIFKTISKNIIIWFSILIMFYFLIEIKEPFFIKPRTYTIIFLISAILLTANRNIGINKTKDNSNE